MKTIQVIHNGQSNSVLLDDEDYDYLNQFTWHLLNGKYPYTGRKAMVNLLLGETPPGLEVDHIDRNPLNNQRSNLRWCTHSENSRNRKTAKHNKLGLKGVYSCPSKTNPFRSQIRFEGKKYTLGRFSTAEQAHQAYLIKAKLLFGDFCPSSL